MKLNFTDFLRKCQFPAMIALTGVPLLILLAAHTVPESLGRIWVIPAAFLPLTWACMVIRGRKRVAAGVICAAALIALGAAVLPIRERLLLLAGPVAYAAALLWALQIAGWSKDQEIPFGWYCAGVITHGFLQVMINATHRTDLRLYEPAEGALLLSFLAYMILAMLSLNRSSMGSASMGRQRIPVHMRRRNVALTMCFLALGVLIAALPAVIRAVEKAWDYIVMGLIWLVNFLMQFLPESSGGAGGGGGGDMNFAGMGEAAEPSLLAEILEKIAYVIAAVIVVVLAVVVARVLYRKLKTLMRYLWKRLSEYAASASEDYDDEITDTRDNAERERISVLERLKKRMAFVDEKKLSPAERIRYRYLRLLYKHADWHEGSTARENLPEAAAALYERARYSEHPVTEEDAESFSSGTKSV